ncbi:MAG: hypothetical protein JHD15_18125 [Phenylobacterium sp.]|jgi:hypothetical protein|uniref:hypothetical protein n=1 Tax=unclassified Phenylobacterium TaxID=2640670 RepID=UPI0008AF1108|nr:MULTISPECIES: hypothetical protein [unclassified Phenylobacterium]MBJ7412263.1 hypothetical protein [Phenylobacterium sp.]OHB30266.1 MAG: hypothetical protein A2790_05505 [Phenylobacterium sp. RIFCSPHIGHO2_01_FULL_69_31]
MASKAPPIPPEQRASPGEKPHIEGADIGRRDRVTGAQSEQPGDDDVNLKSQGRHGNIAQNTTHQGNVQDR